MSQKGKHFLIVFLLTVVFSLPVIVPFFQSGYFPTHDGQWAVVRAAEMFREIRDLQFPPRFSQALNFGYGYPLFNFAYPGPYYITTFIHGIGFNFISSVKILFALTVPLSFVGMYIFSFSVFKKKMAGIISAVLYIYLPYRMVDLYVRGNIGEAVAFSLFPFIFASLYFIVTRKRKMFFVFSSAFFSALLIVSHNIMTVYFGIIFLFFVIALLLSHKYKEVLYVIASVLWGILLSAFFIIPALLEKKNIKLSVIPIADRSLYFVNIQKLLFSPFHYGTPTDSNPFTYQLGLPQLVGSFLSLSVIQRKHSFEKVLVLSFLILTCLFILMMFQIMSFAWNIPLLSEINYPWTLLLPIGFLMSFTSGAVISLRKGRAIGIILCIAAIALTYQNARPSSFIHDTDEYYITNEATTTSSQELMPLWVESIPTERFKEKVEVTGSNYITNTYYDSKKITFNAEMKSPGIATVNTIYYPGWKAYIGGSLVPIDYDNTSGLIQILLPQGSHDVVLYFTETPIRLVANAISVVAGLSFLGAGFMFIVLSIQKKEKKMVKKSS